MANEEANMFTTIEVAERLGVTSAMVRKLIKHGQAQPLKQIGGTWVFSLAETERLQNRPKSKGGRGKKIVVNAE